MLVILPIIFFAFLSLAFLDHGFSLQAAILRAAVLGGVITAVSTELLSAIWALTPAGVGIAWTLAAGAAVFYRYSGVRRVRPAGGPALERRPGGIYAFFLLPAVILSSIVAATALLDRAHIADVLLYHLPRVQFWLQNQTVAFYPAVFAPQLYMPPWTEYAGAHYIALTGTERGIGLVQTASMALCPFALSGIVDLLGFKAPAQILAAAFAITIPQGAMQAYDLKNDYVCAFWMAAGVYFLLSTIASQQVSDGVFAGGAIGLALLTKNTTFLYIAPFIAFFVLRALRQPMLFRARLITGAVLAIAILNAPHWARNFRAYRSPLGCDSANCDGHFPFRNGAIGPRTTLENIVRNIGVHLGTNSPELNTRIEAALAGIIRIAGGDPNDPESTWETTKFSVFAPRINPDEIGNPWHLLLIALAFGLLPFGLKSKEVLPYAACVAAAALLFCVFLRWQPWHTRLHLPLFVLSAPIVAAAFSRWRYAQGTLAAVCLLLFAPVILDTGVYQLLPWTPFGGLVRWERPEAASPAPGSLGARKIRGWTGCRRVGLDTADAYVMEGHLLSILGVGTGGAYVRHINMGPPDDLTEYCAILCIGCEGKPARVALYRAAGFEQNKEPGAMLFYRPAFKAAVQH